MSQTLSPLLIPVVRIALASQGYPPAVVRNDGSFDFSLLSASSYDSVTIWTEFSPPTKLNISELLKPGPPHPLLLALKPTIVLEGPAGRQVVAPYGTAAMDGGWKGPVAVVGALFGVFLLGRLSA